MRQSGMPPVEFLNQRTPFNTPQFLPPLPNSLPLGRKGALTFGMRPGFTWVRSDHWYASGILDNSIAVAITSAKFLDQPAGLRNWLLLRNSSPGTEIIYIGIGKDATTLSTLSLVAGQSALFDVVVPQDDLYVIGSAATAVLSYAYSTIPELPPV